MTWLPASPTTTLMMSTILAQTLPSIDLDARSIGAFFYAMAQTGECE